MRNDISQDIIAKTSDRIQNSARNSDPKLSLVVSRKEILLDDFSFTERRRVRRTTLDTITDVGIAISHPKLGHEDEKVWVSYIRNNHVYLRYSDLSGSVRDIDWNELDINAPSGTKCDVAFIATPHSNMRGVTEYVTGRKPIVFYIDGNYIMYIDTSEIVYVPHILLSVAASDISVRQTPLGLGLFYIKTSDRTKVYYRIYSNGSWGIENVVDNDMSTNIESLSTFNTIEGFGVQAYSGGKLYRIVGEISENLLSFGTWFEVANATGTGAIVEYYNGIREAFFDAEIEEATGEEGGFCYSEGNENWFFNAGKKFYSKHYGVIDFDHTNRGTVYFTTLYHGSEDIIYFIRYVYAKDVSSYTQVVTKTLQTDNPITQINVQLKNIDDSLYVADSTLFAPSSMLSLGVKYGDSEIVDLGLAYIDQATFEHGGETVTLSGRNKTGVYLRDQTFEEEMELNETPSRMVEELMDIFDIDDYEVDTSADGTFENPNIITLMVEAKTNGMKAFQTLNDLLSDDAAGKKWDFEELPDGKIIVGYDEFRSEFNPKSSYIFNGMNDCFAKTVDRSIDGVYTKVRCTGTTVKGKDISYTYNVTNFRFWNAGENRIYHAPHVDGITKTELKKYAKALAKQLKYIGRVITYRMNLKPQLIIGDVAKITYGQEEGELEQLGSITEIIHTLGSDGYFTDFTITSGGDITEVSPTVAYVADKSATGTNRRRRVSDYLGGKGGGNTTINSTTVVGDSGNLPEIARNFGFRFLDEPKNVKGDYDPENNVIKLRWTDPDDIDTFEPDTCEWAGTVVVRNENGNPAHRWDGLLIAETDTRNTYAGEWLIDDNDIKKGTVYYYGIFPYHIDANHLDSEGNPKKHYRWTKCISVVAGKDLEPPVITGVSVDGTTVNLTLSIPTLASGSYESITLVAKKNGTPLNVEDGDAFLSLTSSSTNATFSGLDGESTYYFVIFSEDDQGNVAVSDAKSAKTARDEGWNFDYTGSIQTFTAPRTGIYQLETWGAQGGNASDDSLTARGGYGAYAKGEVLLTQGETIYINVGGQNGYGGGGALERCIEQYSNIDLTLMSDFSAITDAIRNYTSPASTRIFENEDSYASWITNLGDKIYASAVEDNVYTLVDSDYLKITYGKNPSGNYGIAFYNKLANTMIDSFNDTAASINQGEGSDFYLGIAMDVSKGRCYLILTGFKPALEVVNWRISCISTMYNGIDLAWETFKNQV